ncbi:MAG: RNA ligase partner protein [Thermodesulfovibrionia bacterium]|nr:RNA ligase partner protein [Thermodesulfovibrionia bacterium]
MKSARHRKDRIVLDTSLFVNPEVRNDFGDTPTRAIDGFLVLAEQIPSLEFYMPSSILKELMNFVDQKKIPGSFLALVHQKSPSKHELTCPAFLLYELIEDIRDRINKGLRIAEKAVRNVGNGDEREIIQGMRKNYREALREGIIDSKEDVDLILLAKELDALLVTVDHGAIKWAEKLGIRWLLPEKFKDYLLSFIEVKTQKQKLPLKN